MGNNRNILICPLEWGLGHAARMIPLAIRLREMNFNVFAGAGEAHLALFRTEIPGIRCIDFPGFRPVYSKYLPQYLILSLQIPTLFYHIVSEHIRLKKIIAEYKIDIVISDNRFGLWNRNIKTIYITHQLRIPFPKSLRIFETVGILLHRIIIKRYSFCFVPDLPGDLNLSGRLSHGVRLSENVSFMGILSRFIVTGSGVVVSHAAAGQNMVILSGPEPQRTILKGKLEKILRTGSIPAMFLGGSPDKMQTVSESGHIVSLSHLPGPEMKELIIRSERIFARSGYTIIMELISLNRSAILIPTPGQTEQEYLAEYMEEKGWFSYIRQKDLGNVIPDAGCRALPSEKILSESRVLFDKALKKISEYKQ